MYIAFTRALGFTKYNIAQHIFTSMSKLSNTSIFENPTDKYLDKNEMLLFPRVVMSDCGGVDDLLLQVGIVEDVHGVHLLLDSPLLQDGLHGHPVALVPRHGRVGVAAPGVHILRLHFITSFDNLLKYQLP